MRTYTEIFADARDEPAFSNSGQGMGFMHNNCDRCVHDKPMRTNSGKPVDGILGCPVIAVTMVGKTPQEFLERDAVLADYVCVEFRDEDDPGGREPTPIPDPPGQEQLFARDRFEATRMLVQPDPAEVSR